MQMRIAHIIAAAAIAAVALSCAKTVGSDEKAAAKRAFDAWMYVHYPGVEPTGYGVYVIEDIPGDGSELSDSSFLFIEFEQRKLEDSSLVSYTSEKLAKQMGTYSEAGEYGPSILPFSKGNVSQGVYDMLTGGKLYARMKVGGKRTAIIPGWLSSTTTFYDSGNPDDYVRNVSGDNYIYSMKLTSQVKDIKKWQIERLEGYMHTHGMPVWDTTGRYGRYYCRNIPREEQRGVQADISRKFPDDTTIYINYVGRLTSGKVFDTNIEDSAKVWKIYSSSSTYEPSAVRWSADSTAITMGSSTVIKGFALTLWQMHPYESGTGLFISDYGYGINGSGSAIKGYEPLIFEIDIVDKPQ